MGCGDVGKPPNKRLKLAGAHELGKNCVALPASLFLCASTSLRHRRLRPQLKRDRLDSHALENHD